MKKKVYLLFIALLLTGCNGMKNEEGKESNDVVDTDTIDNGTIEISGTENEMIWIKEGDKAVPLSELAKQSSPISASPNSIATIHIDNNPQLTVYLWESKVPVESNSFTLPYETGSYVYEIVAKWPNEKVSFLTVLEVPYEFKRVNREKEPDTRNAWKPSPNGKKQVMIEGLGEFEVTGTIVLKELSDNTIWDIDFNHGNQWTAKKIDWYDDESFLTIIGLVHGTVTRGGDLYHLNVNTLKLTPVIELPLKEEVTDFSIEGDQLTYKVHIYQDDAMTKGYMETRSIDLSTIVVKQ